MQARQSSAEETACLTLESILSGNASEARGERFECHLAPFFFFDFVSHYGFSSVTTKHSPQ